MGEKTLWSGGRLSSNIDQVMANLNNSLPIDKRMAAEDILGSLAWAEAIQQAGILSIEELKVIQDGLKQVADEIASGSIQFLPTDEDIHSAVERRLTELVGATGGKLHTGRSRNDQVVTDFRLWVKHNLPVLQDKIRDLQLTLTNRAATEMDCILPGYTHFQQAQPILFSHWFLSHFWPLERDHSRLNNLLNRVDECPLGCGALAGTTLKIDREILAKNLGFSRVSENSLDAVSDRDFVCDFLYAASMIAMHLSRMAEALILYSTFEFGFVTLSDRFSTGSSLMPQKKNPDSLELIRGKASVHLGQMTTMLANLKGLPSAYDKDLQEDKALFFSAFDQLTISLEVMTGVIETLTVNQERCRDAINMMALATDAADYLVDRGMPFREAHHCIGKAVLKAEQLNLPLEALPLTEWQAISPMFDSSIFDVFSLENAIEKRNAIGGTSKQMVRTQLEKAQQLLNRK